MTTKPTLPYRKNPVRAALKMAVIGLVLVLVVVGLITLIDDSFLDQFKFNLNLGALIGLVVVVNLISLLCFVGLYSAYQWVRCDLKAPRSEDLSDDDKTDQG